MKNRNPLLVFFFSILTFGIYSWYWMIKTKSEMNKMGEKVPTAWIVLIPLVGSFWFYWKYSEGAENVTQKDLNKIVFFIALFLLGPIGQAIVQDSFNKIVATPTYVPSPTITTTPIIEPTFIPTNTPTSTI